MRRGAVAHPQPEVLRPRRRAAREPANGVGADAGADVGEARAEDVLAVTGARHPSADDLRGGAEAGGDVLAGERPVEAGGADSRGEVAAVGELAGGHHRVRPALRGAVERGARLQRREVVAGALVVDQADDGGAHLALGGGGGRSVGAGAAAVHVTVADQERDVGALRVVTMATRSAMWARFAGCGAGRALALATGARRAALRPPARGPDGICAERTWSLHRGTCRLQADMHRRTPTCVQSDGRTP